MSNLQEGLGYYVQRFLDTNKLWTSGVGPVILHAAATF